MIKNNRQNMSNINLNNNTDICDGTISKEILNDKSQTCRNCGNVGHHYIHCKFQTMSYGIICLQFMDSMPNVLHEIVEKSRGISISNLQYHPFYNLWVDEIESKLKILMIRRKDSISYIEFVRGKYELNDKGYLMILFNAMTNKEKQEILNNLNNFDKLWINMWSLDKQNKKSKQLDKDYFYALLRFNTVQNYYDIFKLIEESKGNWDEPEWGFPKGRRNNNESDFDCAIREFQEETRFNNTDYKLLSLKPIYETFVGSNNKEYKHIYYIAESNNNNISIDHSYLPQSIEIGDIRWVSYKEATKLIRSYQSAKLKALQFLFNHLKNIIIYFHYYKKL